MDEVNDLFSEDTKELEERKCSLWYKLATSSAPHTCDTHYTCVSHALKSAVKRVTLVHMREDPCTRVATLAYTYIHAYQFEA